MWFGSAIFAEYAEYASKIGQERFIICETWLYNLHTYCSKEEQRFIMVTDVAKKFKKIWKGKTNITYYSDQIKNQASKIDIQIPKDKKASLDIDNSMSWSLNLLTVNTFDQGSSECKKNESQMLNLLSSPQINITGFLSVVKLTPGYYNFGKFEYFKVFKSFTITAILDLENSKYIFNRTLNDLEYNTSGLDYDL